MGFLFDFFLDKGGVQSFFEELGRGAECGSRLRFRIADHGEALLELRLWV